MNRIVFLSLCVAGLVPGIFAETFKDGETVVFFGDSITEGGLYHKYIADYYLTRFPNRNVRIHNAGVGGDTAGGALKRLKDNVTEEKATSVAVMFGMNDVGGGIYGTNANAAAITQRKERFDKYAGNISQVFDHIQADLPEAKLYFLTPSPYDDAVVMEHGKDEGRNAALSAFGTFVRGECAKRGGTLVDFDKTMNAFNKEKQKADPKYTIIGPDRVHPRAPGHLFMAWQFLKAQGVPSLVSDVAVDAAAAKCVKTENATVSAVAKTDMGVTFKVLEKALPFPLDEDATPMTAMIPFVQDLSRETLAVTGLDGASSYRLMIDETAVGIWTGKKLAAGIDLGCNMQTPQYKQALAVTHANMEWWKRNKQQMWDVYFIGLFISWGNFDQWDFPALQKRYDEATPEEKTNNAQIKFIPLWIDRYNHRKELFGKLYTAEDKLLTNSLRQPVEHTYTLVHLDRTENKS